MKGQASIEALLILAGVLVAVVSIQMLGQNSFESTNAIASARQGVETGITRITAQNEIDISISDRDIDGDNIVFYLTVQGSPPPENEYITSKVENIARTSVGAEYRINVKIEKRVEI